MSAPVSNEGVAREPEEEQKRNGMSIDVEEKQPHQDDSYADSHAGHIHWHTGIKARFPWLGLLSLIVMLLCVALSIVILVSSNGIVREQWPGTRKLKYRRAAPFH